MEKAAITAIILGAMLFALGLIPGLLGTMIEGLRNVRDYSSPSGGLIQHIQADIRRYGDIRLVVGGGVLMILGFVALSLIPGCAPEACGSATVAGNVAAQLPRRLQVLPTKEEGSGIGCGERVGLPVAGSTAKPASTNSLIDTGIGKLPAAPRPASLTAAS